MRQLLRILHLTEQPETPRPGDDDEAVIEMEVFSLDGHSGDWPATEADLDAIVANYNPAFLEAPIKMDHIKGGPSHGWISGLRRAGRRLFARTKDLSDDLIRAVRHGRYKKRSAELFLPDHPAVLKRGLDGGYFAGLAFLGAARPAVTGMQDVSLAADEPDEKALRVIFEGPLDAFEYGEVPDPPDATETRGSDAEPETSAPADDPGDEETTIMPTTETTNTEAPDRSENELALAEKVENLTEENATLRAKVKEFEDRETAIREEAREAKVGGWIKELEDGGQIVPAQREAIHKTFMALDEDGGAELHAALLAAPRVLTLEETDHDPAPVSGDDDIEGHGLDKKAREYAEQKGCSYADALVELSKQAG